jgi:hypothetical protein
MKRSNQKLVGLILSIFLCGCARTPNAANTVEVKKPTQQIEQRTNVVPPANPSNCPTREDVSELTIAFRKVTNEVNSIASEATKHDKPERLKGQITSCREKISNLKAKDEEFISNCEMLLGADGTSVFPEIPVSFQTLGLCCKWLDKALDAITLENKRVALAYVRGAHAATDRVDKLLDGSLRPDVQIAMKIPKYVRKADEELARKQD